MTTPLRLQLEILTNGSSATVGELRRIREESARAASESRQSNASQQQGNTRLGGGIAELAFRYNNVVGALQNLRATAQPVYDALIASNEQLNAQILSSQTNLASSTRLFKGDTEITDPTAKIQASAGALRAAIKQIEIDTQSLVGVTSAQVNELFQITLTNAGALNNQSKQFPDAIAAATSLTKGWAASLKVVGIPLFQARQEINSIIKGQITQDSLLAKNLNITNQQVESWRSQGKLVDELNKRLEVFVAGNGIAARSIEGISSNILDLSQRIGRNVGAPFLEPTISALAEIEKYLKNSEQAITGFFSQLSDEVIRQGGTIAEAFAPLGKTLLEIGADLGPIALSAIKGILETLAGIAQVVAPLANLLAGVVKLLADFAATDLGGVVVQTAAVVFTLTQLATIVTGLAVAAMPTLATATLAVISNLLLLQQGVTAAGVSIGTTGIVTTVATTSMGAFSLILKAVAVEVAALNVSLIVLVAGLAAIKFTRYTKDLEDANNALEEYGKQILATADGVLSISTELNKYNKIVKDGGTLNDEQLKRQKQLRAAATAQVEGIQGQIKALKDLTNLNEAQTKQRDSNIKQLEALAQKADKAAGGLKIESKILDDLGTTAELATKKLEDFNRQINNEGGGEKPAFEAALKGKIALIQSEIAQKRLSVEAARIELEAIKGNTKAELETRNSAKDAIDKIYDGRIAKIKELIEVSNLEVGSGLDELAKIRDDAQLESATRRKAGQQIVSIRKEQIAAESAAIAAGQAQIANLQSQQRIGEARADEESTALKLAEIAKRIEGIRAAEENATSGVERAKLKADREKEAAESEKLEAELSARRRKRAIEDFDERRNLIKAQNDIGLIDRGTYNQQILLNDIAQNDAAISQQREALAKLGANDREGREAINSQIAQLQSKRVEIARAYDQADLKRQTEYYEQELTTLENFKNLRIISETEFSEQKAQNRIDQADAEIAVANRELARLGAADIEGRNALAAKINELENKKIAALDALYQSQLDRVRQFQDKVTQSITLAEIGRNTIIQNLANQQLTEIEEIDRQKLESTRETLDRQLSLAREQEQKLAALAGNTRSPEAERAYQKEVQSARIATAQVVKNIAENESQDIERVRNLAIKRIEDEQAARNRAIDTQLSQIEDIKSARIIASQQQELASNKEIANLDRISKALDLQNNLTTARYNLAKAINDAESIESDLEIGRTRQAIELTKQLDNGASLSGKERATILRQIAELAGTNGRSVFELTKRQQEIERDAANKKRANLLFEQNQAQVQLSLDQQKNDLAIRRSVIEAQINELKAKQSLLDAQSALSQERLTSQRAIGSAQEGLDKAEQLAPGRERERAIADAQSRLKLAQDAGIRGEAAATQGIALAAQQVDLATQNTQAAIQQQQQHGEINRLQKATLDVQQKSALLQLSAADDAKRYADELARAKLEAEGLATALSRNQKPLVDPVGTNQRIQSLGIPSPSVSIPTGGASPNNGNERVVSEIQQLRAAIENRQPVVQTNVSIASADSTQMDEYNKLQRSIARSAV